AWRRIASDSKAFSRQPSVTTRTPPTPCGEGLGAGDGLYVGSSVSEDPTPPSATCACVGSSFRSTQPADDCWLIAKSSRGQGVEHALVLRLDRPAHPDAAVGAPLDVERPAGQRDRHPALGEVLAHGAHSCRTGSAA